MKKRLISIFCIVSMLLGMGVMAEAAVVPEYDYELFSNGVLDGTINSESTKIAVENNQILLTPSWSDQKINFASPIDAASLVDDTHNINIVLSIKADSITDTSKAAGLQQIYLYDAAGTRRGYGETKEITTDYQQLTWTSSYSVPADADFDYSTITAIGFRAYPGSANANTSSFTIDSITLDFDSLPGKPAPEKDSVIPQNDVWIFNNGVVGGQYDTSDPRIFINSDNNLQINTVDWTDRYITFDTPIDLSSYTDTVVTAKAKINGLTTETGYFQAFMKDKNENVIYGQINGFTGDFSVGVSDPISSFNKSSANTSNFDYSNIKKIGFRTYPGYVNGASIEFSYVKLDIPGLNNGVKKLTEEEVLNDGSFSGYTYNSITGSVICDNRDAAGDKCVKIAPTAFWGLTAKHIFDYTYDIADYKNTAVIKFDIKFDGPTVSDAKLAINDVNDNKIVFTISELESGNTMLSSDWTTLQLRLEDGVKNEGNSDDFDYSQIKQMYFWLKPSVEISGETTTAIGGNYYLDNISIIPEVSVSEASVETKLYVMDWNTETYTEVQSFTVGDDMKIVTGVTNASGYDVAAVLYKDGVPESIIGIKPYNESGVYNFEDIYSDTANEIRVFVWDFDNMKPIGSKAEFFAK